MNIDQEIAERLGLCWHKPLTEKQLNKLPILGSQVPKCKKCGASKLIWERYNPYFSTSTATLKAEAIRAGKWEGFWKWNVHQCIVSGILKVGSLTEILTTPELLAQAFLSYLKENE